MAPTALADILHQPCLPSIGEIQRDADVQVPALANDQEILPGCSHLLRPLQKIRQQENIGIHIGQQRAAAVLARQVKDRADQRSTLGIAFNVR